MTLLYFIIICVTRELTHVKIHHLKPNNWKRPFLRDTAELLVTLWGLAGSAAIWTRSFLLRTSSEALRRWNSRHWAVGHQSSSSPGFRWRFSLWGGRGGRGRGWYLAMEPNPTEGQCRSVGGPAGPGSPPWRRSRCPLSFPWPFLIPQALDVPGLSEGATAAAAVQCYWRTKPRQAGTVWDGDGPAELISLLFIFSFFFHWSFFLAFICETVFSCTQMMLYADRNAVEESFLRSGVSDFFFLLLFYFGNFLSLHTLGLCSNFGLPHPPAEYLNIAKAPSVWSNVRTDLLSE